MEIVHVCGCVWVCNIVGCRVMTLYFRKFQPISKEQRWFKIKPTQILLGKPGTVGILPYVGKAQENDFIITILLTLKMWTFSPWLSYYPFIPKSVTWSWSSHITSKSFITASGFRLTYNLPTVIIRLDRKWEYWIRWNKGTFFACA